MLLSLAEPEYRTMAYLLDNIPDAFTFTKTICKIWESYHVSAEDKAALRALRKTKIMTRMRQRRTPLLQRGPFCFHREGVKQSA